MGGTLRTLPSWMVLVSTSVLLGTASLLGHVDSQDPTTETPAPAAKDTENEAPPQPPLNVSYEYDDPVEDLRITLREPAILLELPNKLDPNYKKILNHNTIVKEFRRNSLKAKIAALKTLPDLRRALLLPEWREDLLPIGKGVVDEIRQIDLEQRKLLADEFRKVIHRYVEQGNATARLAVASMIADDIPPTFRAPGGDEFTNFTRLLTADVLALTRDKDIGVRQQALTTLSVIHAKPDEAAARFREALAEDNPRLQLLAAQGLSTMMAVVNSMRLPGKGGAMRITVPDREVYETAREVVPACLIGMQNSDWRVRAACLEGIHQAALGLESIVEKKKAEQPPLPPLQRELSEMEIEIVLKEYEATRAVFKELEPFFRLFKDTAPQLAASTGDPEAPVRLAAITTLSSIAKARLIQRNRLMSLPLTKNTEAKLRQENKLIIFDDPLGEFLQKYLSYAARLHVDRNPLIRLKFFEFVELLEKDAILALPALVDGLNDPDVVIRLVSARTFKMLVQPPRRMSDEQMRAAVPGLASLLGQRDPALRRMAAKALEGMGTQAGLAKNQILAAICTSDIEGRLAMFPIITHMTAEDAAHFVPELIHSLSSPDWRLREGAAKTLGRLGATANSALATLRSLIGDPVEEVRRAARDALLQIMPAPF